MSNGNISGKQRLFSISVSDGVTCNKKNLKEGDYVLVDLFHIADVEHIDSIQEANDLLSTFGIDSDESTFEIYEAFMNDEGEEILTILTNLGPRDIPAKFCLCIQYNLSL